MAYILKDGYLEIRLAMPNQRTGECLASEDLKQGMAVSKGKDSDGNPVVSKASGDAVHQGNLFVVAFFNQSELDELVAGQQGLLGTILEGKQVVTIGGPGVRVATDQYVGSINDYDVGDELEIGTSGNAGLFTNVNATPSGDPAGRVAGKDHDKLIVDLTL